MKEAKKHVIRNDDTQSIIHIFNHNYIVDGKTFLEEPIGVYADTLSHEMTFITMPKNYFKNINQAFIECDIEVWIPRRFCPRRSRDSEPTGKRRAADRLRPEVRIEELAWATPCRQVI